MKKDHPAVPLSISEIASAPAVWQFLAVLTISEIESGTAGWSFFIFLEPFGETMSFGNSIGW
jgi:hypothetical protein